MDEGDRLLLAEARGSMPIGLAAVLDRSFGGLDNAAERLDEGRLASPILSKQRENFPGMEINRNAAQRRDAAEPLDDPVETNEW